MSVLSLLNPEPISIYPAISIRYPRPAWHEKQARVLRRYLQRVTPGSSYTYQGVEIRRKDTEHSDYSVNGEWFTLDEAVERAIYIAEHGIETSNERPLTVSETRILHLWREIVAAGHALPSLSEAAEMSGYMPVTVRNVCKRLVLLDYMRHERLDIGWRFVLTAKGRGI